MRRIVVIFLSNPKFLSTPLFLFFVRNFSLQKKTKMAAKKSPAKKSTKKPVAKKTKAPVKKSAPKVRTTESDNVASGRFSSGKLLLVEGFGKIQNVFSATLFVNRHSLYFNVIMRREGNILALNSQKKN